MVNFTGYFDESGTHVGSAVVSVAGYVSLDERWASFQSEWQRAMDDYGLPFFHMTDFTNSAQAYAHWPEAQKRIRFGRLVDIINSHVVGSIGTAIATEPFNRLFSAKAKAHCGGAYGLAALASFVEAGRIANGLDELRAWDLWIAYVFEGGAAGRGQFQKAFEYNRRDPAQRKKLRPLSLRFEDRRASAPLQAADILAYELYRQLPRQLGLDSRPPRQSILRRLAIPARSWGTLDEAQLKMWSEVVEMSADIAAKQGWPRRRTDRPAGM